MRKPRILMIRKIPWFINCNNCNSFMWNHHFFQIIMLLHRKIVRYWKKLINFCNIIPQNLKDSSSSTTYCTRFQTIWVNNERRRCIFSLGSLKAIFLKNYYILKFVLLDLVLIENKAALWTIISQNFKCLMKNFVKKYLSKTNTFRMK